MGRRGPSKTPTELAKLRGHRKDRINTSEPKYDLAETPCPGYLSKEAKAEWARVAPQLLKTRVFTETDVSALAAYCSAVASFQRAEEGIAKTGDLIKQGDQFIPNPYYSIRNKSLQSLLRFAQEFGFTPSSRTGIVAPPEKDGEVIDGKARFMRKARGG